MACQTRRRGWMWALLAAAAVALGWRFELFAAAGKGPVEIPWSFRPIAKAKVPAVQNAAWPKDDLDRFVLAKLEEESLQPAADTDRATLLRRVTFDLTGLPPTEEQIAAFLGDRAPDDEALATVIDALLASPQFGERWARHWLDVIRYADSVGRTWNPPFTYAWRYRDWVIDALNSDLPYDQFITAQLAGDLLPARTVEQRRANLVATGFLTLGTHDLQGLSQSQFEMDCIDEQIDVTTRAFLGLTVSCARCHDHKYDPVTMHDYYALAGIFQSTRMLPGVSYRGQGNGYVDHEQLVVLPVSLRSRPGDVALAPGVHSMNDFQDRWRSGERDIYFTTDPNLSMGVVEGELGDCAIRIKGDPRDLGDTPRRGDVRIPSLPRIGPIPPNTSGRLQLAKWIASKQHPLTARVAANRAWQHLLGTPLVSTPDDFGMASEEPEHVELLDHLAQRFMAEGWSLKNLVRAIVLSRTYRLSSDDSKNPAREKDPGNTLYWRANLRRLEWEPLRDALMHAARTLSLERPEGIQVSGIGGKTRKSSTSSILDIEDPYRTVYLPVIRSGVPETYSTFDFPDPCQISGRREVTTVAPQALFFMNSRFVERCAARAAENALSATGDDAGRVAVLYRRLFGREPNRGELIDAQKLLAELGGSEAERWQTLAQALFATAEFRYIR